MVVAQKMIFFCMCKEATRTKVHDIESGFLDPASSCAPHFLIPSSYRIKETFISIC
jgi:hypothetical protein